MTLLLALGSRNGSCLEEFIGQTSSADILTAANALSTLNQE